MLLGQQSNSLRQCNSEKLFKGNICDVIISMESSYMVISNMSNLVILHRLAECVCSETKIKVNQTYIVKVLNFWRQKSWCGKEKYLARSTMIFKFSKFPPTFNCSFCVASSSNFSLKGYDN